LSIQHLTYKDIDKQKWDSCIQRSVNRLIYAKSFYLDAMAQNWEGLVLNDYEAVMPLTWKKKWGISYLYQPAFMQQGGIFFTGELSENTLQAFINKAFSIFNFAEITLNYLNKPGDIRNSQVSMRNNFVLPLNLTYEDLSARYPAVTKKNLKRAKNQALQYEFTPHYLPVLKLYKQLYAKRLPYFTQTDYRNFSRVCKTLGEQNNLIVRTVTNSRKELLAGVILLIDRNRLYNIVSCITEEGKPAQANYFLYDRLIQEFCKSKFLLDFEGSDEKGIAAFYSRFMPQNESYPFIKMNNLHPILKLFKH
jgi:Acetyltransferase (GNAT) domain